MSDLSKKEIIQFSAGGGASSLIFQFISTYLLFFYVNIVGLEPAKAASLILIMKVVDAIFDIVAANIIDGTNFFNGMYRPFIIIFSPVLGLSIYSIFTVNLFDLSWSGLEVYISVATFSISLSFCNMAYNGLVVKMSNKYDERAIVITYKQFFGIVMGFFASFLPLYVVEYFGGGAVGWHTMAFMVSVAVVVLFYVSCFGSKHRDYEVNCQRETVSKISICHYVNIFKENTPLAVILVCQSCFMFAITLEGATVIYFFIYQLQSESSFPIYQGIVVAISAGAILLAPRLVERWGKKKGFCF